MTKKLKILVLGSCWPTNIGNAFVNIGEINCLKRALGDMADIYHFGTMSSYLFWTKGLLKNDLNISNMASFDYVVVAGMTQCSLVFESLDYVFKGFERNNTKIIILGGGPHDYNDTEVNYVRNKMKNLNIFAFVSRDKYSFEHYADLAIHSLDGIDSAFFVSDNFESIPFSITDYNVINFDIYNEPIIINAKNEESTENVLKKEYSFRKNKSSLFSYLLKKEVSKEETYEPPVLDMEGKLVIRTHHAPWPTAVKDEYFTKQNTLISDLPSDYLNIYSQANIVYSDRIHACIAALAFGRKAMLFGKNVPRLKMFERVGVGDIMDKPVKVDIEYINILKQNQVEFIKKIIKD